MIDASYNLGSEEGRAGIHGTAFFLDPRTCVTAHHLFNGQLRGPDPGFSGYGAWLAGREGQIIPLVDCDFVDHPEIDVTVIRFRSPIEDITTTEFSAGREWEGEETYCHGYRATGADGYLPAEMVLDERGLVLQRLHFDEVIGDSEGPILKKESDTLSMDNSKVTEDPRSIIRLSRKKYVLVGTVPIRGQAGAPVLLKRDHTMVGMQSFDGSRSFPGASVLIHAEELRAALGRD